MVTVRGRRGVFAQEDVASLERFLLGHDDSVPTEQLIRLCELAPYAYSRVHTETAERATYRQDYLAATARHLQVKARVQPLIAAWDGAGIASLVFKGFYLAEFVHPSPAHRPYRDVDILIDPLRAQEASAIACSAGWIESWRAGTEPHIRGYREVDDGGHEVMHLDHPELGLRLDVHRRIVHNKLPWTHLQNRLTDAVWDASVVQPWGDANLRRLCPEDSIIVGIVLNRCWNTEDWHVRPHDILDMTAIVDAFGISRASLLKRSNALGCANTVRLFLQRCDPFLGILDLAPPPAWRRHLWNVAILNERGHPMLERTAALWSRVPHTVVDVLTVFPHVVRALWMLRRAPLSDRLAEEPVHMRIHGQKLTFDAWRRLKRGARWGFRILRIEPEEHQDLWSFALYLGLLRRGYEPRLQIESSNTDVSRVRLELRDVTLLEAEFVTPARRATG